MRKYTVFGGKRVKIQPEEDRKTMLLMMRFLAGKGLKPNIDEPNPKFIEVKVRGTSLEWDMKNTDERYWKTHDCNLGGNVFYMYLNTRIFNSSMFQRGIKLEGSCFGMERVFGHFNEINNLSH